MWIFIPWPCNALRLDAEPVLLVLLSPKPVLLGLPALTTMACGQLKVSIVLDHGRPIWVLVA